VMLPTLAGFARSTNWQHTRFTCPISGEIGEVTDLAVQKPGTSLVVFASISNCRERCLPGVENPANVNEHIGQNPAPNADALGVLKLRVVAGRLHRLPDAINHNVGPVDNDEMPALLSNQLLAVPRKGQQVGLEFLVFFAAKFVCTSYIDDRLVPERVRMTFADCVGGRDTSRHDFMVRFQGFLIARLRNSPKMKLAVPVRQLGEVGVALNSNGDVGSTAWI